MIRAWRSASEERVGLHRKSAARRLRVEPANTGAAVVAVYDVVHRSVGERWLAWTQRVEADGEQVVTALFRKHPVLQGLRLREVCTRSANAGRGKIHVAYLGY